MDYLLIWVTRGRTRAVIAGREYHAGPGDLLTFEPHVPQHYAPDPTTDWEWLWVHFAGPAAPHLLHALRTTPTFPPKPQGESASLGGPGGSFPPSTHHPLPSTTPPPLLPLGLDERLRDRFLELVIASPPGFPGHRPPSPPDHPHRNLLADAALLHLLALMLDRLSRLRLSNPLTLDAPLDLPAFQRYVHDHLAEPLTVDALARRASLSPAHFSRLIRRALGVPPMQYVIQKRMDRAATLLTQTPMKLTAIAQAAGYDDPYYFSRLFKKVTGVSPSAYRSNAKANNIA